MPKINQEEYEILVRLKEEGNFEWIARDEGSNTENDLLWAYEKEPFKSIIIGQWRSRNRVDGQRPLYAHRGKFQSVQWEDEEPYSIAELIEEYEEAMQEAAEVLIEGVRNYLSNLGGAMQSVGASMKRMFGEENEAEPFQKAIDVGDEGIKDNQERQLEEETEVKDLEWVKAKLKKDHKDGEMARSQIKDGEKIDGIDLDSYWRGRQTANYIARCYLEDLDELEVLSREWISENVEYAYFDMLDGSGRLSSATAIIKPKKLQNLLVPKQEEITEEQAWEVLSKTYDIPNKSYIREAMRVVADYVGDETTLGELKEQLAKPVIPQFVADWYERHKDNLEKQLQGIAYNLDKYGEMPEVNDMDKWINETECPLQTLASLKFGYDVEEEPLYRARLKVITDEFIASYLRTQSSDAEDRLKVLEIGSKYIHEDYRHLSEFTEDELKRLDVWGSEQWEVEELEE